MIRTFYFPIRDFAPNVELLRNNKESYRRFVDAAFGLDALPDYFARFADGKLIKPVLSFG